MVPDAGTALHLEGLAGAGPRLRQAVAAVRRVEPTAPELFQLLAAACSHATLLGDDITLHELAWRPTPRPAGRAPPSRWPSPSATPPSRS
ncbi:hypothetical protein ACWDFR_37015 [Streptomyces sp. 900105755]